MFSKCKFGKHSATIASYFFPRGRFALLYEWIHSGARSARHRRWATTGETQALEPLLKPTGVLWLAVLKASANVLHGSSFGRYGFLGIGLPWATWTRSKYLLRHHYIPAGNLSYLHSRDGKLDFNLVNTERLLCFWTCFLRYPEMKTECFIFYTFWNKTHMHPC